MTDKTFADLDIPVELKESLNTAFEARIETVLGEEKTKLEAEYIEKLTTLQEAHEANLKAAVDDVTTTLQEELDAARALDVTYAQKLTDFKVRYAEVMAQRLQEEVQIRVDEKLEELHESITESAKNSVNAKLFEAVREEFAAVFATEGGDDQSETIEALKSEIQTLKESQAKADRERIVEGLLATVTGKSRDVAATILESVATDKLEEKFNSVIGLLNESITQEPKASESKTTPDGTLILETVTPEKDEEPKGELDEATKLALRRAAGLVR